MCHWVMCGLRTIAHLLRLRTIHRRVRHLRCFTARRQIPMFKEQRHLGVRLPSLRLCLTLATAAAEPANRRKSAANGREMEDQVLELQSITRHEEPGDGIVEQLS
jgi:hypothetical protein